ncbi:MAG: TlpA disulfide reductase family protein [Spirochaetaceae bacterium]|nr:TlpA disulfide reductase family protein [Spirochaetaceae bacterium]MDT8297432.1 TlpA disulfide reductase family protein [Spirochaetaceae bacterium]
MVSISNSATATLVRSITLILLMLVFSIGIDAQTVVEERLTAEGFAIAPERPEAPDFTLKTLGGEERSLSSYQGSVVFLNFWATWCGPCRVEMPSMDRLYQGIDDDRFEIVAVDLQEDRKTVEEFAEELGFTFPILLDEKGIAGSMYGISGIPTTFLIDKNGGLVARLVGSREWDTKDFRETIGMLMDE